MMNDELYAKYVQIFSIYLPINNSICGKLVSLAPVMFDDTLKVTTVTFLLLIFIYQAENLMNLHLQS